MQPSLLNTARKVFVPRRLCIPSYTQRLCRGYATHASHSLANLNLQPHRPKGLSRPGASFPKIQKTYFSQFNDIVFPDPNRTDLFYHYANPPTPISQTLPAFALSFLSETPPSVDSASVIGWLPATSPDSEQTENEATLADFRQNSKFIEFLHELIKSGLKEGVDDVWKDSAMALGDGWLHIHDQRNPPDQSRIGDPDDIIASVLVKDSQIQPDTYEPMPSYRVCTADGVLQLTPGLAAHLRRELLRAVQAA